MRMILKNCSSICMGKQDIIEGTTITMSRILVVFYKQLSSPLKIRPSAIIFAMASNVKTDVVQQSTILRILTSQPSGSFNGCSMVRDTLEMIIAVRMNVSNLFECVSSIRNFRHLFSSEKIYRDLLSYFSPSSFLGCSICHNFYEQDSSPSSSYSLSFMILFSSNSFNKMAKNKLNRIHYPNTTKKWKQMVLPIFPATRQWSQ